MSLTSQVVPAMLESVRPKLQPYLVAKESAMMKMVNKAAEKHNVSAFTDPGGSVLAWRVPVQLSRGGDYQAISLDNGDLGSGSMMNTSFMAFSTFENNIAYNVPMRAEYATKDQKQAIVNVMAKTLQDGVSEMALYNEIGFFNDSTGTLAQANGTGTPAISGGKVTYNLETSFASIRLRGQNALVDVYDTNNLLQFTGARVNSINFASNTVTLSGVSTYTPAATDQIMFPNMGLGAARTTYTAAAGSWRNGLYVFSTTTTSGSIGGLSYATAYELATPQVNGQSGFYTPSLCYSGKSQLVQRRDEEAYGQAIGICHMAQRVSAYLQAITIANWLRDTSNVTKNIDIPGVGGTNYGDTFEWGDVKHYISRYAGKTRVDWIVPGNFGWVQLKDIDFIMTPDGQKTFIGHSSTTGNPTANTQFYLQNTRNLYSVDPGAGVVFFSMAIPSGQ